MAKVATGWVGVNPRAVAGYGVAKVGGDGRLMAKSSRRAIRAPHRPRPVRLTIRPYLERPAVTGPCASASMAHRGAPIGLLELAGVDNGGVSEALTLTA
jgi:hypothetical protein